MSGFDKATVICLDNSGDSASGVVMAGKANNLKEIIRFSRQQSLGWYYGMMTQYLGFQMTNDEYKVMGLASYGSPKYLEEFKEILKPNGIEYIFNHQLDKRYRDKDKLYEIDFSTRQERTFTNKLEEILGPRRIPGAPMLDKYLNIASSAQAQLDIVAKSIMKHAIKSTTFNNVCLAGGVALNCKMNMELMYESNVNSIYVPPVPHDAGVSLGAAILKMVENGYVIEKMTHAYYGNEYSDSYIYDTLLRIGVKFTDPKDLVNECTDDLLQQKKIGWFQGRMEFGPRALGNRSILADPRSLNVKDNINSTIKYREEFRPFCPSILFENQKEYIKDKHNLPFMVITSKAKEGASKQLPSVILIDITSRIQSVKKETNPLFHELISDFNKKCGCSALLNTSLNINEQPTVNSPLEAIHTFFCSGLDTLYLGPFKLNKE